MEVYYFLPSSFSISEVPNSSQIWKAESKVILCKRARDREESTFPSLTELSETNIAVSLAFAVAINACCCNQNVPRIKRLLKVYWVGTRFWQRKDDCSFKHLILMLQERLFHIEVLSLYTPQSFLIVSRKYNGKNPGVLKHLKRPAGHTSNKLLLPNYSISFKASLFTEGQNNWNTTKHTENCSLRI